MNAKGLKFIHDRSMPMDVDSMAKAAEVIFKAVKDRDARIKAGQPFETDKDARFGTHLAWLIGFDHLIDDRKAVHDFTEKLV